MRHLREVVTAVFALIALALVYVFMVACGAPDGTVPVEIEDTRTGEVHEVYAELVDQEFVDHLDFAPSISWAYAELLDRGLDTDMYLDFC